MYQSTELFANLSPEDITATLEACALPDKGEYVDDEEIGFESNKS